MLECLFQCLHCITDSEQNTLDCSQASRTAGPALEKGQTAADTGRHSRGASVSKGWDVLKEGFAGLQGSAPTL